MAALYPPWSNTVFRSALAVAVVALAGGVIAPMVYVRAPWNTQQFVAVDQPVEFDHRHHVQDDEIDCLYCHRDAEVSASAGIPATEVCMGCHAQIWNQSPLLEPVRRSYFSEQPLAWNRVHDLGDFAYFNHSVHVRNGVGCVNCHGAVEGMSRVFKVASLAMEFCLNCHRDPQGTLLAQQGNSREHSSAWAATVGALAPEMPQGTREITRLTTCTACHR